MMKRLILLIFALLNIMCGDSKISFNENEINLINKYDNSAMPLFLCDDDAELELLKQVAKDLNDADLRSDIFKKLKNQMLATVTNPENTGVGIAAPQVGISRRLIAVQRFDKDGEPFEFYANIRIKKYSDEKQVGVEGCLSVPNMRGIVERAKEVVIEYTDIETLEKREETLTDFVAVIFQHEIDHLDGVLYIDIMQREYIDEDENGESETE